MHHSAPNSRVHSLPLPLPGAGPRLGLLALANRHVYSALSRAPLITHLHTCARARLARGSRTPLLYTACLFRLSTMQTVGDAISDLLLVQIILIRKKMSMPDWAAMYDDLPNRLVKVKVLAARISSSLFPRSVGLEVAVFCWHGVVCGAGSVSCVPPVWFA